MHFIPVCAADDLHLLQLESVHLHVSLEFTWREFIGRVIRVVYLDILNRFRGVFVITYYADQHSVLFHEFAEFVIYELAVGEDAVRDRT